MYSFKRSKWVDCTSRIKFVLSHACMISRRWCSSFHRDLLLLLRLDASIGLVLSTCLYKFSLYAYTYTYTYTYPWTIMFFQYSVQHHEWHRLLLLLLLSGTRSSFRSFSNSNSNSSMLCLYCVCYSCTNVMCMHFNCVIRLKWEGVDVWCLMFDVWCLMFDVCIDSVLCNRR